MPENVRQILIDQGLKATRILDEYFDGKRQGTDMVKEASKAADRALKADHLNQIQKNTDRSFGLRLMQFLPKDEKVRNEYIKITNPEVKGILMAKPEKK